VLERSGDLGLHRRSCVAEQPQAPRLAPASESRMTFGRDGSAASSVMFSTVPCVPVAGITSAEANLLGNNRMTSNVQPVVADRMSVDMGCAFPVRVARRDCVRRMS